MMKTITYIAVLACLLVAGAGRAEGHAIHHYNPVKRDTIDPLVELLNIEASYTSLPQPKVNRFNYYYTDHDTVIVRDTALMEFAATQNKYWLRIDSVEQFQDGKYNVTLYHDVNMQQLIIQRPTDCYKALFQADLLGNTLRRFEIANVSVTDTGFLLRSILFNFKPASSLHAYKVVYDKTSYNIQRIEYTLKKEVVPPGTVSYTPTRYIEVRLVYIPGETGNEPEPSFFDTGQFFTRQNGILVPVAPYTHYELINAIQE
jgi:hypothetical protein